MTHGFVFDVLRAEPVTKTSRGSAARKWLPVGRHSETFCPGKGLLILGMQILVLCFPIMVAAQSGAEVDYESQIRPILSDHCFACHGPDGSHREADLRFDQLEEAVGPAGVVVPGDLDGSEFWNRVTSDDPDMLMPPPHMKKPLSDLQLEQLRQWISQGADYTSHWAFRSPQRPSIPEVANQAWQQSPIDAFLYVQMSEKGMQPSPMADRRTLLRRLSLDLTGLPPTLDEVRAFLEDDSPDAYRKQVDRLLDSPRFGERMAISWLDQARYADTNGYSIDGGRNMWLWRDWVIRSFNENLPYDDFLTWQMAGDLLPGATQHQRIATGFHRNHSITHEGGTIPEENLVNYVADRVKTTGETFLGLTLGCAQCHDHKFDPVSQKDYYQIFAYFNSLEDRGLDGDGGRNSVPNIQADWVFDGAEQQADQLRQKKEQLVQQMQQPLASIDQWEQAVRQELNERGKGLDLIPLEVLKVTEPNRGQPFDVLEDGTIWVPSPSGRSPSFSTRIPLNQLQGRQVTGLRIEFTPDPRLPHQGVGHGNHADLAGNFLLTSFSCSSTQVPSDQVDLYRQVELQGATASSYSAGHPPMDCLDPRDRNGWAPASPTQSQHITFRFAEPLDASDTPYLTSMLVWGGGHALIAGRYRFYAMVGNDDGTNIPESIQELLQIEPQQRTAQQRQELRRYYATVAPEWRQVRANIQILDQRIKDLSRQHSTMVMNTSPNPRKTYVLTRGQYDQPAEEVQPDTPGSLPSLGQFPPNRLGLAQWMTHPDHPLVARVAVNRYWQQLFGRGLVHPTADFGLQGPPPTHPELLDFLALEFVESGWNIKDLIRRMVMTQAYQQSSKVSPYQLEKDPLNLWLGRGARYRLPAEVIRDNALYVSGMLVERLGGPPVFPYQPPGLWREVSHFGSTPATAQVFVQDRGENLYRRSLYTYWKRTVPPPSMQTFDAPNREICVMDRPATNTPLQSLVLLNDVQFVEAARSLGERILQSRGSDREKIQWAFETVTTRPPTDEETKTLLSVLDRERNRFEGAPSAATALIRTGDSRPDLEHPQELAAWTVIGQLLLNLSETITRG